MMSSVRRLGPAFLLRITWAMSDSFMAGAVPLAAASRSRTPCLNATSGALTSATASSGIVASKITISAGLPTAMP